MLVAMGISADDIEHMDRIIGEGQWVYHPNCPAAVAVNQFGAYHHIHYHCDVGAHRYLQLQKEQPVSTTEGEINTRFEVTVANYGRPDVARESTTRNLAIALHRAFGPKFSLKVEIDGKLVDVNFDPLAHDGEHEGHDEPVKVAGWLDPPPMSTEMAEEIRRWSIPPERQQPNEGTIWHAGA